MLADLDNWLKARQAPKPGAIRVACIGNSITDGHGIDMATAYGYPALLQKKLGEDYWVKNFGVSARTMLNKGDFPYMNELAWRDALAFKPDIVVIKLGTNDSKPHNWQYGQEFKQDLQQMIKALGKAKIYLCTPIPAFKSTWDISDSVITNSIIPIQQEVARKNKLQVIDLHTLMANDEELVQPDGIHPNNKGVAKMADIIAEAIK
jgi:lysophospholipase L1-like esterase